MPVLIALISDVPKCKRKDIDSYTIPNMNLYWRILLETQVLEECVICSRFDRSFSVLF